MPSNNSLRGLQLVTTKATIRLLFVVRSTCRLRWMHVQIRAWMSETQHRLCGGRQVERADPCPISRIAEDDARWHKAVHQDGEVSDTRWLLKSPIWSGDVVTRDVEMRAHAHVENDICRVQEIWIAEIPSRTSTPIAPGCSWCAWLTHWCDGSSCWCVSEILPKRYPRLCGFASGTCLRVLSAKPASMLSAHHR